MVARLQVIQHLPILYSRSAIGSSSINRRRQAPSSTIINRIRRAIQTALYLEGIAVGVKLAALSGDDKRRHGYLASLTNGFNFLDRLVIQEREASLLPNAEFAIGGCARACTPAI